MREPIARAAFWRGGARARPSFRQDRPCSRISCRADERALDERVAACTTCRCAACVLLSLTRSGLPSACAGGDLAVAPYRLLCSVLRLAANDLRTQQGGRGSRARAGVWVGAGSAPGRAPRPHDPYLLRAWLSAATCGGGRDLLPMACGFLSLVAHRLASRAVLHGGCRPNGEFLRGGAGGAARSEAAILAISSPRRASGSARRRDCDAAAHATFAAVASIVGASLRRAAARALACDLFVTDAQAWVRAASTPSCDMPLAQNAATYHSWTDTAA